MIGIVLRRAGAVLLALCALLAPAAGYGQEEEVVLPAVRVRSESADSMTATKTDTPVLETPQSVTTITRGQLDERNPQTVKDALNYTAGVLSAPDTTTRYDSLFMRGFGGSGTTTRIVDFLDGLKLPRGQAFAMPAIDPFLLDRIDVLRGPSAVLYGQTSPGGLVNQVSRPPLSDFRSEARVEAGSHGRLQSGVASQGPFDVDSHWQYSISAIGRRSGTRYDDVDEERAAISPAITWEPTEDTRLTLQAFYQNDPEGGYFNSIYTKGLAPSRYRSRLDDELNVGDPDFDSYDREQSFVGYSFDHRFSDAFAISSKTRYSTIRLDLQSLQMAGPLTSAGLLPRQAVRSVEDVEGVASDNRVQFDFATGAIGHTATAGIDYQHSVSNWEYKYGAAPSLDVTDPHYGVHVGPLMTITDSRQTMQQTGVYGQDQLSLGGWRVLLGARYDWTKQDTENRLADAVNHQTSRSPSYRAGVLYLFDVGIAPYASYSTSFEPTVGVDAAGDAFKPTEAEQWEVGIKYEPTAMDALFTVSAFHILQENVLSPGAMPGYYVQQGEIRSRGLEFEARGKVLRNLELIGSLTLLDTEVTESTDDSAVGKRPQAVPEYFGSVWVNYGFDSGLLDGFSLGGGFRAVGGSYADDANINRTAGYALVDAAVRYDLSGLGTALDGAEATLNVTNLLDREYYSSSTYGYYSQYGTGRQVLLGLRYTW